TGILSLLSGPFASGPMTSQMFTRGSVISLVFLIIFPTIFGYGLQVICQKYAPPAPASIIMGMEAVFAVIASYIFLNEVMTARMITGCIMMVAAMLMVEIDIMGYFYPDEYLESAYSVDYEKLYAEGKRGIIFDIDNTLVMHDYPPDERSVELLSKLDAMGFAILFLSNNKEQRVKSFRDGSVKRAKYIYKAGKPLKGGYMRAMQMMDTDTATTVFIGDQLFTDVWGAKRCGIMNILVRPIHKKEEIQIIMKRQLERIVLSSYRRSGRDADIPHAKNS
ncbi:MAG: YqeG family HAD IIIA-type phosphatase, partial [Lachnospiraceae bacterium]|nr:YqeG family HAD IIIA-type phosphatase [Lachnospiraceae bacterium]